jgi:predicted RNase H-like nuclease (RuvC/YqgF family)
MATEIEELRTRKERLKDELLAVEQIERSLQEDTEILEEKIEIRDLEEKLEAKRESVKQLESRKSGLQDKWNQPAQDKTKKNEEPEQTTSQLVVNVEPNSDSATVQPDESNAKKKHAWF